MKISDAQLAEIAGMNTTTNASACSTGDSGCTIDKLLEAQKKLWATHPLQGLEVNCDESGMMCPENGYVIWVGRKLYKKLKGEP